MKCKLLLVLLICLMFGQVHAQMYEVREITIRTLAENDNALKVTVFSNLSTNESMFTAGNAIVVHYTVPTRAFLLKTNMNHMELLLVYSHLMAWQHIGELMMYSSVGNEFQVSRTLWWADWWTGIYLTGLHRFAAEYGYTPEDLDQMWDTERFGEDPR